MNTMNKEQLEAQVVKSDLLRKGDPLLIAGRGYGGMGRGRTEAQDLRSKFEPPLRASEEERQAADRLGQVQAEAQRLLDEARQQAAAIIADATASAAALRSQNEAEMRERLQQQESETASRLEREYREKYCEGLTALCSAADSLEQGRTELLASLELPAFEMIQLIARQLLMAEISHAPQFITGLISRGLCMLNEGSGISLRLHPEICQLINDDEQMQEALRSGSRRGQQLSLEADAQLPKAAFRLLTDGAEVAFDLDESLGRLDKMLAAQLFVVGQQAGESEAQDG